MHAFTQSPGEYTAFYSHVYVYACTCMHAYTCTHAHTRKYTYIGYVISMHAHTYTHIHIHLLCTYIHCIYSIHPNCIATYYHYNVHIPGSVVTVMGSLTGPSSIVTACIVHSYVVNGSKPAIVPIVLIPTMLVSNY